MMSIRLRFSLLYSSLLALTLAIFGISLYTIQSRTTLNALKTDLTASSETLGTALLRVLLGIDPASTLLPRETQLVPFHNFSTDKAFQRLPEREIARILDANGKLVASPWGLTTEALPLSAAGLSALQNQTTWWETASVDGQSMLIYSQPVIVNDRVSYILQVARPLTERNRSLHALATTLVLASLATVLVAFGIGWVFSGVTLRPVKRITHTAREIGAERDFTRRVDYTGPPDEVGQLATTFNSMLERLQEAYQRVAHSLAMERDFVADVSHELRTPLTTLRGNLGLLTRTPPIPRDEAADIVNDMVDESDRLIRLVNELLVLARADAGRSLAREPFEVRPVLEESLRQVQQLDAGRQLTLDAPAGLQVRGDRDAFKQVALILLDNALKHSQGPVHIRAAAEDGQAVIRVRDEGPGIPPERLEHVFDRFYRGEEASGRPGFGLGLAIARSLVEGQGGTIVMESQVGQGSTVILRFAGA